MKLTFDRKGDPLPVSQKLMQILDKLADESGKLTASTSALTFNFRDKSYSAENGGYHPVEIRISKENSLWDFEYITDFSYQGHPFADLAKDVDFDFMTPCACFLHLPEMSLNNPAVIEFYKLWESNFIAYFEMGVFDQIKVFTENR